MNTIKTLRFTLSLLVALFFVGLIFRQINFHDFSKAILGTELKLIPLALFALSFGYFCRIHRWHLMLKIENPNLHFRQCLGPFLSSFALNNVLPFRAGDVIRTFAFNKQLGVGSGSVLASLLIERLLDLLLLLTLLAMAILILSINLNYFYSISSAALLASIFFVLLLIFSPQLIAPIAVFIGKLASRFIPKYGDVILNEINIGLVLLRLLAKGHVMTRLLAWSTLAWLSEGCMFYLVAKALPSIDFPISAWLALPVGTLATLIPSTPGYVGTFDYFTVHAMAVMKNTIISSTTYAFLLHILLWFPPTLIGGGYLLLNPIKFTIKK